MSEKSASQKVNKGKNKIKILDKLKSIKHIEIVIALIFGLVLILLYVSTIDNTTKNSDTIQYENTVSGYISELEYKLENILNALQGVSNASVIITLDMTDTKIDSDSESIVLSDFPSLQGIIVVARGVDDVAVKINVIKAIQTLFEISSGSIEIFLSN